MTVIHTCTRKGARYFGIVGDVASYADIIIGDKFVLRNRPTTTKKCEENQKKGSDNKRNWQRWELK